MRLPKLFAAASAALALAGCGTVQPEIYKVTLADLQVPASCYAPGSSPGTPTDTTRNTVDSTGWVLWAADDDEQFLDLGGNIRRSLGDAYPVNIDVNGDAITGKQQDGKLVFVVERTQQLTDKAVATSATYTFDARGPVARGTITYKSVCTGVDCRPSCEATVDFTGVRVDASRQQIVNP